METIVLSIILGFILGVLWERWKYYRKTGKHLQDYVLSPKPGIGKAKK